MSNDRNIRLDSFLWADHSISLNLTFSLKLLLSFKIHFSNTNCFLYSVSSEFRSKTVPQRENNRCFFFSAVFRTDFADTPKKVTHDFALKETSCLFHSHFTGFIPAFFLGNEKSHTQILH